MNSRRFAFPVATLSVALLLTWLAGGITPTAAEGESVPDSAEVADQLAGIRAELGNIGRLLTSVEGHQRVSVLMARIRLKQQRLSSLDGQVRSIHDEQESAQEEIEHLTAVEGTWTSQGEELQEGERFELELLRQRKTSLENRIEVLRLRAVELENDLARSRDDVLALEEAVDEQLGLR